jgi:uncharacterized repeat protein (TIGR03803 family)
MTFSLSFANWIKKLIILCTPASACALLLTLAAAPAHAQFVYADIHDFASPAGYQPIDASPLTLWSDGNLYGTSQLGGANDCGTIFGVSTSVYNDVFAFNGSGNPRQCGPVSGLTQANGYFYGATSSDSTVFRYNPSGGTMQVLHALTKPGGDSFLFAPVVGKDGNLYGVTRFGKPYRINATSGAYKPFSGSTSEGSSGPLYEASDGNLYGTSCSEFVPAGNTVFTMSLTGVINTFYTFSSADCPIGGLAQPNGATGQPVLYGVARLGGANGTGYIFQLDTSTNVLTDLYDFGAVDINGYNADGAQPEAALLGASDGNFYGTALSGGPTGEGTIFELKAESGGAWSFINLFDFTGDGGAVPGGLPQTPLWQHPSGVLYGTAYNGGEDTCCGVAYSLTPFNPWVTVTLCCNNFVILDQPVQIYGVNLEEVEAVTFAGAPAQFQQISPTYLTAQVPAGAIDGQVTVTAINSAGGEEQIPSFQTLHILPTVTTLSPGHGAVGSQVLINGGGFANASAVAFNGVPATVFSVQAPNVIVAKVPSGATSGKITITTPNGTATSKQRFTVTK